MSSRVASLTITLPVLCALVAASVPVHAGPIPSPASPSRALAGQTPSLAVVSELPTGTPNAVAIAGDRAYAGLGKRLMVLELKDGTSPDPVGYSAVLSDTVTGLAPLAGHVLAAAGSSGTVVYDVSDPTQPTAITAVQGRAAGVAAEGDLAAVVGEDLRLLDVTDPSLPVALGRIEIAGTRVFLHGERAYVAGGASGLFIVDVADPTLPALLGGFDTPGAARDVFVRGDTAYIADQGYGLRIVDVADPAAPVELGFFEPVPGQQCYPYVSERECITTERVAVVGDTAYLLTSRCESAFSCRAPGGLRAVDVSDPAQPLEVGAYDDMGNPADLAVAPDRLLLAAREVWWYAGVAPCSLAAGSIALLTPDLDLTGRHVPDATIRAVEGDGAYVFLDRRVLDVADPSRPSSVESPLPVRSMGMSYGSAVVTDVSVGDDSAWWSIGPEYESQGTLLDSEDDRPDRPQNGCSPPPPDQWYRKIHVTGGLVYALDSEGHLRIHDAGIRNERIGEYTEAAALDLFVADGVAYLAEDDALRLIDVADPTTPTMLSVLSVPAKSVEVIGAVAYVAGGADGLFVVDVSEPTSPQVIAQLDVAGSVLDVDVQGRWAWLACGDAGLLLVDVTFPRKPVLVGGNETLRGAFRARAADTAVAVLADGGLYLIAAQPQPRPEAVAYLPYAVSIGAP